MPKKTRSRNRCVLVYRGAQINLERFKVWVHEQVSLCRLRWTSRNSLQLAPGFTITQNVAGLPLLHAPTGDLWPLPNTQEFISKIYHKGPHADSARDHQIVY